MRKCHWPGYPYAPPIPGMSSFAVRLPEGVKNLSGDEMRDTVVQGVMQAIRRAVGGENPSHN